MPCSELCSTAFARLTHVLRTTLGPLTTALVLATTLAAPALTASEAQVNALRAQPAEPQAAAEEASASDVGIKRQIGEPAEAERTGDHLARVTDEVSAKLRCPVCQGMSVADSPSASAVAMKNEISELLRLGYSETQVKNYFESTYGEFVLLDPKREGLNWLLWLAPGSAFFGGLIWILVWNKRRSQSSAEPGDLDPYLDQVRAHLDSIGATSASNTDGSTLRESSDNG